MSKLDDVLARAKNALEFEERGDALDKEAIKDVFLEAIGDDWPTAGYGHAVDREDKKAWLVNDVLAKIRQRVEEL